MTQFYKVPRKASYNYGGKNWKLSRSKIDLFLQCPRCFYLDAKLGVKRPPGYPYNINSAVDSLLKNEFDAHRAKGTKHPLQKKYKLSMRPAKHELIDQWRENFTGVQTLHEPTGMTVFGAIDDLWINDEGEYIVVDYKATAKSEPVMALDKEWQDGYKRQMEIYQWLLRRNDLPVSDTGYFVYCTGRSDEAVFDGKVEFDVHVIPYTGSDDWVEDTLFKISKTLRRKRVPKADAECDYCRYRDVAKELIGVES